MATKSKPTLIFHVLNLRNQWRWSLNLALKIYDTWLITDYGFEEWDDLENLKFTWMMLQQ